MSVPLPLVQAALDKIHRATTLREAKQAAASLGQYIQENADGVDRFYPGFYVYDGAQPVDPGWDRFSKLPYESQEELLRSWGAPERQIHQTIDAVPGILYQLYQHYHP
jgi:hypothetical protein